VNEEFQKCHLESQAAPGAAAELACGIPVLRRDGQFAHDEFRGWVDRHLLPENKYMKKVILGTSGAAVSEVCLGTMHLGSNTPDDVSVRILDAYREAGGAFLDTANIYNSDAPNGSGGDSEQFIGRWMKDRGNRDEVFLATKVGMVYPGQEPGLRANQIEAECHKSLPAIGRRDNRSVLRTYG